MCLRTLLAWYNCSSISPARRLAVNPYSSSFKESKNRTSFIFTIVPVAQNVQPIEQPTCAVNVHFEFFQVHKKYLGRYAQCSTRITAKARGSLGPRTTGVIIWECCGAADTIFATLMKSVFWEGIIKLYTSISLQTNLVKQIHEK